MTTPRPLSEIARNLRFNADHPCAPYEGLSLIACDRLREAADALDRAEARIAEEAAKFHAETNARSAQVAAVDDALNRAAIPNGQHRKRIYDALYGSYNIANEYDGQFVDGRFARDWHQRAEKAEARVKELERERDNAWSQVAANNQVADARLALADRLAEAVEGLMGGVGDARDWRLAASVEDALRAYRTSKEGTGE